MSLNQEHASQAARLFVAAFPDTAQLRSLKVLVERIHEECGDPYTRLLRWVVPEKWHMTLRFLGDVPRSCIPSLKAQLRESFVGVAPFPLRLGGISGFPRPEAARVLYVGVEQGKDELRYLAGILEGISASLPVPPETKVFTPHLTFARTKRRKIQAPRLDFQSPSSLFRSIYLVESELSSPLGGYKTLLEVCFK